MSCAIKPVVQGELGRYTIATGHTGLEGFNRVPGPRLGVSWLVWAWAIMVLADAAAGRRHVWRRGAGAHLLVPAVPVNVWVGVCLAITLAVLLGGGYARIEKLALVKVGFFTLLTVCAAAVLLRRPGRPRRRSRRGSQLSAAGGRPGDGDRGVRHHRRGRDRAGHVSLLVRREGLRAVRRAARRLAAAWVARARGWIRVMHLDILCSLVIYTLATVAFYLLGAGVLNRSGLVPAQRDTIQVLSRLYTQTLGEWALWLFYGRGHHALRHHLRVHGRALAALRRRGARRRRLRQGRRGSAPAVAATGS